MAPPPDPLLRPSTPRHVVLVKHALPTLDPARPPREWLLSDAGTAQSKRLADRLRPFAPLRLITSPEPKARGTANIVAAVLGVPVAVVEGLKEFDRPALPLMSKAEHARFNRPIFADPDRRVLGTESGAAALERFSAALTSQVAQTAERTLVAITHGTVIALFAGAQNRLDAFDLWRRLACPAMVVLELPGYRLVDVVEDAG